MTSAQTFAWDELLHAAATDRFSGASAIASRAAAGLELMAHEARLANKDALVSLLATAGRDLLAGQPSMASLFSLLNRVVISADQCGTLEAARKAVRQSARTFVSEQSDQHALVARLGAALIRPGLTVMTHSHSQTVVAALLRAHHSGRAPRVICTESRPRGEGYALARQLHAEGINTTLVLDAAAFGAIGEADLVLVGADSLALPGLYNKVGTAGLAWAASARNVPCYVLATTGKAWPAALGVPPRIAEYDPAEVWADAPDGLRVVNRYFDVTPWSAIAGVVTEQGMLSTQGVTALVRDANVHPALLDAV